MILKPISISLSPNTEKDDIFLALKLLFQPWRWKKEKKNYSLLLEKKFKDYLPVNHAFSFNSGRSCLMAILSSLNLEKNDEILLQTFTCNAAVNPILWSNLKPVFIDVNQDDFNINIQDLKNKITVKTKAVIVQHTFGLPAELDEIIEICQKNNLILIEDCAHSLASKYKGKNVGVFGQVSFFSFSRDKIISSVYGGIAVTNDEKIAEKIKEYQQNINYPSFFWIKQQLLHPVLMNWLILPSYRFLGKYLLISFQFLNILSKAVHWREKRGLKPSYFPKKMPNSLAVLALNQFEKLEKFNQHRKKLAWFYYQELKNTKFKLVPEKKDRENIFLRFTVRHEKAHQIIKKAWQKNILIGDWYTSLIAPNDTKLEKFGYNTGDCLIAEKLAKQTLNLPTHINISQNQAKKIIEFLKQWK
jgi:perosamine synthetase